MLIVFLVALLLLTEHSLDGRIWQNIAYIGLNRDLATFDYPSLSTKKRFQRAIVSWPDNTSAKRGWALLLFLQQDEAAAAVWSDLPSGISEVMAWGRRARRYQHLERASDWYHFATQVESTLADPWYFLGSIAETSGQYGLAQEFYLEGIKRDRFEVVGRSDFLERLGGLSRQKMKDNGEIALRWYNSAIREEDFHQRDIAYAFYGRAELYRQRNEFKAAIADYQRVLALQPRNYWANIHLGVLMWSVERDAETALELLRRAAEQEPELIWSYRNQGDIYTALGVWSKAKEMYQRVVTIDPDNQYALDNLRVLEDE